MTDTKANSEKWLLWAYGILCAVLLLVLQVIDVLVTDAPEPWYQNTSYMLLASGGIALTGVLLLVPFKQPFALFISVATSLLIWPIVWLAEQIAGSIVGAFGVTGEYVVNVFIICIGGSAAVVPSALEYTVRHVKQKFDNKRATRVY